MSNAGRQVWRLPIRHCELGVLWCTGEHAHVPRRYRVTCMAEGGALASPTTEVPGNKLFAESDQAVEPLFHGHLR